MLYLWKHVTCGSMLQGITEEIKKQAEQRINSRFIMYVPGVHNVALKNTQKGVDAMEKSAESRKLQKSKRLTWIPRRSTIADRQWNATSKKKKIKGAWKRYAETDMEVFFNRMALEKRITQLPLKKTGTRSRNPIQEEAATP